MLSSTSSWKSYKKAKPQVVFHVILESQGGLDAIDWDDYDEFALVQTRAPQRGGRGTTYRAKSNMRFYQGVLGDTGDEQNGDEGLAAGKTTMSKKLNPSQLSVLKGHKRWYCKAAYALGVQHDSWENVLEMLHKNVPQMFHKDKAKGDSSMDKHTSNVSAPVVVPAPVAAPASAGQGGFKQCMEMMTGFMQMQMMQSFMSMQRQMSQNSGYGGQRGSNAQGSAASGRYNPMGDASETTDNQKKN